MLHGKNISANKLITYDLDFACEISKRDLKDYVSKRLRVAYPEGISLLTHTLLNKTLIYLEGYAARLKEEMEPPVNIGDVRIFIMSEGFKYIYNQFKHLEK